MRDHNNDIFGSLAAGARGHRSLGDESYMSAAVAAAGNQHLNTKPLSVKGWNNSTRASPLWKKQQQDKENNKLPVPKKFQHVQSRLTAPIFQQRTHNLQPATLGTASGALSEGGPLQTSSGILNCANNFPGPLSRVLEDDALSPEVPAFVTVRRRGTSLSPVKADRALGQVAELFDLTTGSFASPQSRSGQDADQGLPHPEAEALEAILSPCPSPHPSVAALYQYAQRVQTPLSNASGQAHDNLPPQQTDSAQDEDLTESFSSWLAAKGIDTSPLSATVLSRLRELWLKAKEALRLQALVKQLTVSELAQEHQAVDGQAQHAGSPVCKGAFEAGPANGAQEGLMAATDRLLQLALSDTPSTSPVPADGSVKHAACASPSLDGEVPGSPGADSVEGPPVSASLAASEGPAASVDMPAADDDITSASVASWTCHRDHTPERSTDAKQDSPVAAVPNLSPNGASSSQAYPGSDSLDLSAARGVQPSMSINSYGARITPGLSVLSQSPEHVPFAVWAAGVNGGSPSQAAPRPTKSAVTDNTAASACDDATSAPGAPPSGDGQEARDTPGYTPTKSAGLSIASKLPQPVAFNKWAHGQQERPTPTASVCPQGSPVTPCGNTAPASSRCDRSVSKPQYAAAWDDTPLSTPAYPPSHAKSPASGAELRSNPLFEFDSPASSMSMTLPVRTDAMPGVVTTPPPEHPTAIPSLASTPMSEVDGLQSISTSPFGNDLGSPAAAVCSTASGHSPGLFRAMDFGDMGDMPTPVGGVNKVTSSESPARAPEPGLGGPLSPCSEADAPSFGDMPDVSASPSQTVSCSMGFMAALSSMTGPLSPQDGEHGIQLDADADSVHDAHASPDAAPAADIGVQPAASSGSLASVDADSPSLVGGARPAFACEEVSSNSAGVRGSRASTSGSPAGAGATVPEMACAASPAVSGDAVPTNTSKSLAGRPSAAGLSAGDEHETEHKQLSPDTSAAFLLADCLDNAAAFSPPPAAEVAAEEPQSVDSNSRKSAGQAVSDSSSGGKSVASVGFATGFARSGQNSYANTPSANWSPASNYFTPAEVFPSPRSMASYGSAIQRSALRMYNGVSTPANHAPSDSGATAAAEFTFGLRKAQQSGGLDGIEAATPGLALEMPGTGPCAVAGASPLVNQANASSFGSPFPLMHLTPAQMRVLDNLASKVIAAFSPGPNCASPASPDATPEETALGQSQPVVGAHAASPAPAAGANYNLAQLLANLRSPMPVALHQHPRRAVSTTSQATLPCQQDGQVASTSPTSHASATVAEGHAGPEDAAAEPTVASPMPSFMKLMAFLNGPRRPAEPAAAARNQEDELPQQNAEPRASAGASSSGQDCSEMIADHAVEAAAAFSFAQLLAHLHAPRPKGPSGGCQPAASNGAALLTVPEDVDSPVACGQDSPATSEAASFGFSTAAKQMDTRVTPGVSFVRWAREAPPSFLLDSDAAHVGRRKGARTPSTPLSFSFGARMNGFPIGEEGTPGMGPLQRSFSARGFTNIGDEAHASPAASFAFHAAVNGTAESPAAAFFGTTSPAFSFGLQIGSFGADESTPARVGGRQYGNPASPALSVGPAPSLGLWGFNMGGHDPSIRGSPTPSELAFAFGSRSPGILATPVLAGLANAAATAAAALTADGSNPAGINNVTAAVEHVLVAMSPTLFGMAAQGSPGDTPGVTQPAHAQPTQADGSTDVAVEAPGGVTPGPAAFWAALMRGNLQSPMPAAVHGRLQHHLVYSRPESPPAQQAPAPSSLNAPPAVNSSERLSAGLDAQLPAPLPANFAVANHKSKKEDASGFVDADAMSAVGGKLSRRRDDAPPPYEDLPELIARGLCLSASPSRPPPVPESAKERTAQACSCMGENPTPVQATDVEAFICGAGSAALPTLLVGQPTDAPCGGSDRLFIPTQRVLVSPPSATGCSLTGASPQLLIESISDSNRSGIDMVSAQAGRTTEPVPTPERLVRAVVSGCNMSEHADANSVHSSPVLSFGAPSDDLASGIPTSQLAPATASPDKEQDVEELGVGAPPGSAADCCPSPRIPYRCSADGAQHSPLTFSYLGSGGLPSTPPTKELASVSKGSASLGHRQSALPMSGGSGQFWAPSPSGPAGASGERVTLEVMNRRIRANADLLLDFQGSPGQPVLGIPVSGAVTPRMKVPGLSAARPGAPQLSPVRKSWDLASSFPADQMANKTASSQGPPLLGPSISGDAAALATAGAVDMGNTAAAPAGTGLAAALKVGSSSREPEGVGQQSLLRPSQAPPLHQLVAAGIDDTFTSAAATLLQPGAHKPISQRLGLWPSAVWNVQSGAVTVGPTDAASPAPPLMSADSHLRHAVVQAQAGASTPHAAASKPAVTSRDVQTTPGLERSVGDKAPAATQLDSEPKADGDALPKPSIVLQAQQQSAPGARKPGFRSRIPVPASVKAPLAARDTSASGAPAAAPVPSSSAVSANDDEGSEQSSSVERVIRRHRLLAGAPQRVPVKAGAQRGAEQPAESLPVVGEEEMRRRARVLGVRISPYLRSKANRVRAPEQQQPKKG